MDTVTVKLADPTKIYWDMQDDLTITGDMEVSVERNNSIDRALTEKRLVIVNRKPVAPDDNKGK